MVWSGQQIYGLGETFVLLRDAKTWPFMMKIPYTLDKLKDGVLHDDDLSMALTLDKALEMRIDVLRRKKGRIDKQLNSALLIQKAMREQDQAALRATAATQSK